MDNIVGPTNQGISDSEQAIEYPPRKTVQMGINRRYYSIRFRNKNCDSTKKGLGYGETRLLIM